MNELTIQDVVEETKSILRAVRGSVIRVAQNLWKIKETYSDEKAWGTFVEEELEISQGFASKLLTINRIYLVEGGLSPEKLEGVDYEKLYLARKIEGSAELKLATAKTLKRQQVKQNRAESDKHEPIFKEVCVVEDCWLSRETHP